MKLEQYKCEVCPYKQKWIPCSEKLPEEEGRYICDYDGCIDFGLFVNGAWYVSGAVAWMPLPEKYKGDKT